MEALPRGATLPAQGSLRHTCCSLAQDTMPVLNGAEWQGKLIDESFLIGDEVIILL